MTDDMNKQIRADLDLIRKTLGSEATDNQAAGLTLQAVADHLREGRFVITREDLSAAKMRYATHVASAAVSERVEIVALNGARCAGEHTGDPTPEPPLTMVMY